MTDGRTDRRTDGGDCNIPYAFLKKRGDNNLKILSVTNFCRYEKYHVYKVFRI